MKFSSLYHRFRYSHHLVTLLCCALLASLTAATLWTPLQARWLALLDPFSFNGDALQHIAPLWFVHSPTETVSDYTLRYYLEAILPALFKGVYAILTLWMTPPTASKVVTICLSLTFILISTVTARRLSGVAAGCLAFFLATAGVVKNLYFMGGIQRGFGFCIAALALYLTCCGRLLPLAGLGIVAAMLYPAAAILILTVFCLLLFLPSNYRGSLPSWSVWQRLCLLAVCAILVGAAVTPQLLAGGRYGQRLSIDAANEFEEWGPHGRYTPGDRGVPVSAWRKILTGITAGISPRTQGRKKGPEPTIGEGTEADEGSAQRDALIVIFASLVGGLLTLLQRRGAIPAEPLRCALFVIGTIVAFYAAATLFPLLYIPARYVALGTTACVPVLFPALWSATVRSLMPSRYGRFTTLTTLTCGVLIVALLGWQTLSPKRLPTASGSRTLFAFIRSLPADTVIASWPRGIPNMIPLFTARSVLVFEEGHQIFHRDFLEEMRRRTRALIAAYAATDLTPIVTLRRDYNVSHILVNRRHLTKPPDYFAPFGNEMRNARAAIGLTPLILTELIKTHAVFTTNDFVVIDIRNLQ